MYTIRYIVLILLLMPGVSTATVGDVIYLAFTDGYWQVWSMYHDGSNQQQITTSEYDKSHISWYPDGNHILVNGNQGRVSKVNLETRNETTIDLPIKGTTDATISPMGDKIVFSLSVADSRDNNHIWTVNESGKNLQKITNMSGLQHEPVWSFDKEWIYFISGQGGESHDIWRVSSESGTTEQLTVGQLYHFDLALSQDNKLAFSTNRYGNYDIWIREEGKDKQLTKHGEYDARPSWSPDGNEIVFESTRSGVINIWRIPVTGGEPVQMTQHQNGARYPVWHHATGQ